MSGDQDDASETLENDSNIIYLQYADNVDGDDENILIAVSQEAFNESGLLETEDSPENSADGKQNSELVEINYAVSIKNDNQEKTSSPENINSEGTAALCEATYEEETNNTHEITSGDIDDLPREVLVYTCPPEGDDPLNHYLCKICGIIVGCVFCLKSHYESIHLNLGIIQYRCQQTSYLRTYTEICNKCNLVCESQDEMVEHRKIHFVSCEICQMSFDSALYLSNHCKTAHEKFEVSISCDLCENWFKQLQELSDHYETYHEMIVCIVCFRRFATREELDKHLATHKILIKNTETVLPYACSKCNQAFAEISELSGHLSKDHPKAPKKKENLGPKARTRKKEIRFDDCGGLTLENEEFISTKRIKREQI